MIQAVLAVDVVCLSLAEGRLQVLLVKRSEEPFVDQWALAGGVVGAEEGLERAAGRVLYERTRLAPIHLEQLYTFGDPGRDPRGRTVSVAYFAMLAHADQGVAGRGSAAVEWWRVDQLPPLAFDHGRIVSYARWRLAQKLDYTPLAFHLLPETFTMGDLRQVHEAVGGQPLDPSNFNRQMLARWDLAPLPGLRDRRTRRPARVYRFIGDREIAGAPAVEEV